MKNLVGKDKPFHSAVDKSAGLLKRKVGTGAEFMKELMGLPGISQSEIKERNLGEIMGIPRMTHDQFMANLAIRPVPAIREKVLGEAPSQEEIIRAANRNIRSSARDYSQSADTSGEAREMRNDEMRRLRELHRPQVMAAAAKEIQTQPFHGQYTLPGGENYREMLIKAPKGGEEFGGVGAHFGGEKGILASMRLKDRLGPNGEKLLHLEELQSDWHQQGRDKGYNKAKPIKTTNLDGTVTVNFGNNQNTTFQNDSYADDAIHTATIKNRDSVPDAPFKKNWEEMALKRLIHHAAEKGYHGIVVTPGAEQADRYSLAKHISGVDYVRNELKPQRNEMIAYDPKGNVILNEFGMTPEKLEEHIGKEAAQKLLSQEPQPNQYGLPTHSLRGEQLVVGGEGMKAFYDKKVPNILNSIGKKYGVKTQLHAPVKVGENKIMVPFVKDEHGLPKTEPSEIPLHHFPITEEMRKDVLANGLPLYKEGGIIHSATGGNVQPSINQMRMDLMSKGHPMFDELKNVGANEAPGLDIKAFVNPGRDMSNMLPTGGVDMNPQQPGQQLMPPAAPQQQQQSAQAPQGQPSPLGGAGQMPGQQSNILQMTPQGQALNAIKPQQPQGMAYGGEVDHYSSKGKVTKRQQTVKNAQRMAYPGIYSNPADIAALAASRVAQEDPALKQLFGVTRADMYAQAHGRQGMPHLGMLPGAAANPKGSMAAEGVMNKRNEQRLIDVMAEAKKHQGLVHGMEPWYYMNPLFDRMVQLLGIEKATEEYRKMNALMGMASSSSEVNTEIPRGSLAYYLQNQGRFKEFVQHGGKRSENRPADFGETPGHLAHKTAHALPMQKFLERGEVDMNSPKVPMYIEASGVPATGFQTRTPVGDAHWSRAVGLADTRNPKTIKGQEVVPGASVSTPEMSSLGPWWANQVAGKLGMESVPAQALTWGAFSPQTGVTTPIGAPKLELIAKQIMQTANRLGVSPQTARDMVLTGKERMGKKAGGKVKLSTNMDTINLELNKRKKAK